MEDKDLEFLLAVSPVLQILAFHGSLASLHARIANQSLRCAQFCLSILEEVAVVNAPSLERLFLWRNWSEQGRVGKMSTTVKIGHALSCVCWDTWSQGAHSADQQHHHQGSSSSSCSSINVAIATTSFSDGGSRRPSRLFDVESSLVLCGEAGTKASARTTVSSVQMLALQLHFGDRNQVKMLPSFLRCFPNLDTLIIESFLETTSNRSLKFWQGTSPIECRVAPQNSVFL
ncbi:hypothetical protein ZWY2020_014488 [Hordeum vulgare]|nr:hypothetical protein ZWY2020_014488 [Hordeum vulgare]